VWRSRWRRNWDQVKYCSERCRRSRSADLGDIERAILQTLASRSKSSTICPSEVLPPDLKSDPVAMELVRQAARRLCHDGRLEILQRGKLVYPTEFRGPIRLRLNRKVE
jgi:hypothetical protein